MALRIKKNGKPNLSGLKKATRKLVRAQQAETINNMVEAFILEVLNPDASRAGITASLAIDRAALVYTIPEVTVIYTEDNSIDPKSLIKPLKRGYKTATELRQAEIQAKIQARLVSDAVLTSNDLERIDRLNMLMRNPFKGKFKPDNAA